MTSIKLQEINEEGYLLTQASYKNYIIIYKIYNIIIITIANIVIIYILKVYTEFAQTTGIACTCNPSNVLTIYMIQAIFALLVRWQALTA